MKDKSDKKKDMQDLKKALADHKNFFGCRLREDDRQTG